MKLLEEELREAEKEKKASVSRLNDGIIQATEEGCYLYKSPYGWKRERINRQWTLVPHPEQHERLLTMIDLALNQNKSCFQIKQYFESRSWPSPTGKAEWSKQTVRDILSNERILLGRVSHGKKKTVEEINPETFDSRKVQIRLPEGEYLTAEGLHDAILTQEQFDELQRKIHSDNPKNHRDKPLQNYFSGLLKCGYCADQGKSAAMIRQPLNSRRYKVTRDNPDGQPYAIIKHSYEHDCGLCKGAPFELVESTLISTLQAKIDGFEILLTDKGKEENRKRIIKRIASLDKDLDKARLAREKIYEAYECGDYSRSVFHERRDAIDNRIEIIKQSIDTEEAALPVENSHITTQIVACTEIIKTLQDTGIDAKTKNDFLKEFISEIRYYNDMPRRTRSHAVRLDIIFLE